MNKDLMITQQDLIDWIDRPPSNDDLDLATFISTRLEKFYDLEHQLQQKENIIKEVREYIKQLLEYKKEDYYKGVSLDYVERILDILEGNLKYE